MTSHRGVRKCACALAFVASLAGCSDSTSINASRGQPPILDSLDAKSSRVILDLDADGLVGVLGPIALGGNRELLADPFEPVFLVVDRASGALERRTVAGAGPGEYTHISGVFPFLGDSVLVADRSTARVTVLDSDLRYARSFQVMGSGIPPQVLGVTANGSLVLLETRGYSAAQSSASGVVPDSASLSVLPTDGMLSPLRKIEFAFSWVEREEGRVSVTGVPLAPRASIAVGEQRVALSDGRDCIIVTIPVDGVDSESKVRFDCLRRSQTAAHREAALAQVVNPRTSASQRKFFAEATDAAIRFETLPELGGLLWGRCGVLWAQRYFAPGDVNTEWMVFDAQGDLIALVMASGHHRMLRVTPDSLDMIVRSVDDAQFVSRYAIRADLRQRLEEECA